MVRLITKVAAARRFSMRFPANVTESPRLILSGANLHPFAPVTYIWEVTPFHQIGYQTSFFWGNNDGTPFDSGEQYVGFNCYPYEIGVGGTSSTGPIHHWEISVNGTDTPLVLSGLDDNGNSTIVEEGRKMLQSATVQVVGANYVIKFYWDLEIGINRVITYTFPTANYHASPAPAFFVGGNAWASTTENLCGDFGRLKIITNILSTGNIVSESQNMSGIMTMAGGENLWLLKKNWANFSIADDAGSGRTFAWADSNNKPTLVAAA